MNTNRVAAAEGTEDVSPVTLGTPTMTEQPVQTRGLCSSSSEVANPSPLALVDDVFPTGGDTKSIVNVGTDRGVTRGIMPTKERGQTPKRSQEYMPPRQKKACQFEEFKGIAK